MKKAHPTEVAFACWLHAVFPGGEMKEGLFSEKRRYFHFSFLHLGLL